MPISQNQALFSLLGTTYGGDGRVSFALPNLQGRVPIHTGGQGGHVLGETGGEQNHTLTISEMPTHMHVLNASSLDANNTLPGNNLFAKAPQQVYVSPGSLTAMQPTSVTNVGGSQPHPNMQPFLTINFSIALQGIFPSQN